jgi:hypothetical protein
MPCSMGIRHLPGWRYRPPLYWSTLQHQLSRWPSTNCGESVVDNFGLNDEKYPHTTRENQNHEDTYVVMTDLD